MASNVVLDFTQLFVKGTGRPPYPFQKRLAAMTARRIYLNVPTGAGKTAAAFFAWLWQKRFADERMRSRTPRRLVYCLPMRVLVEQTRNAVDDWLHRLELEAEIGVTTLMGGEEQDQWDLFPERDTVLIGTQDMLLSRALNRGYGMSRYRWPMHFGLINNDCRWVVDEVQLMGSGLPSTAQLQSFRERFGIVGPSSTLWMSATFMPEWLKTVDFEPSHGSATIGVDDGDLAAPELQRRLNAYKALRRANSTLGQLVEIADEILRAHRPATRTLVVVNTVGRALDVYGQLAKLIKKQALPIRLVLVHSRFRPHDRRSAIDHLLANPAPEGTVIVSTQVVEAGVDVSAITLFTELAPWASLVQRFGRCNRAGESEDATVYWLDLPANEKPDRYATPYEIAELLEAREILSNLNEVGPSSLPKMNLAAPQTCVLRSKDLVELFDTTPDLAGRDIDVSRFIRESSDLDVQVFWRGVSDQTEVLNEVSPVRDELCPAPISEVRELVAKGRFAWIWDGLLERWRRVTAREIYPGVTLMLRAADGGYSETEGWLMKSREPVPLSAVRAATPEGNGSDRWAETGWMTLAEHTDAVVAKAAQLADALPVTDSLQSAVVAAAAGMTEEKLIMFSRRAFGPMTRTRPPGFWPKVLIESVTNAQAFAMNLRPACSP